MPQCTCWSPIVFMVLLCFAWQVTSFQRSNDDELLILASDGLWDVFTCQDATNLALRSTQRARERGASRTASCRIGASVLTRAAIERGSRDNITVVLVDLRRPDLPSLAAVLAAQCSDEGPNGNAGSAASQLAPMHSVPLRRAVSTVTTAAPGVAFAAGVTFNQHPPPRSHSFSSYELGQLVHSTVSTVSSGIIKIDATHAGVDAGMPYSMPTQHPHHQQ